MWRWLEFLWFNYILSWRQALNILHWEIIFQHDSIITISAPDKNSSNSFFSNFMCWVNLSVEWEEGINYNKLGNYKLFHHKKVEKYLSCRCWWSVGQPRMINYLNIVRHYHPLMSSLCHHFIITEPQEFIKQELGQFPSSSRKPKISCIMSQKLNKLFCLQSILPNL